MTDLELKWENPEKTHLVIADARVREAYASLTGRDYIRFKDIQPLRDMGYELIQDRNPGQKRNLPSLKAAKKILEYQREQYNRQGYDESIKEVDEWLKLPSVEKIINATENQYFSSYITMNGLYDHVQRLVITESICKKRDINGNLKKHYIKVYTVHAQELLVITKEVAFALGYDFVCLPYSKNGYVDQYVMDYMDNNERELASKLSDLLYNGTIQLESRSI